MLFPHADGAGALLHKRKELFAFCGRDGPDGFDTATKKAEVINLGRGDRARSDWRRKLKIFCCDFHVLLFPDGRPCRTLRKD